MALHCIDWFLIIIAIMLHFINMGAGVFFTQNRLGKNEKIFKTIKFKTMSGMPIASCSLMRTA